MNASFVPAVRSSSSSCVHFRFVYQNYTQICLLRHSRTRILHNYVNRYVTRWKVLGIVRVMSCYRPSTANVSSDVKRLEFKQIRHNRLCEGCLVMNK